MILRPVNLSTGPVGITRQVQKAFREPPISHRSVRFRNLLDETSSLLSKAFNVRYTCLITGSGTLANDIMLQEIKAIQGKGLVLANGEFGDRLIVQARRIGLNYITCQQEWGQPFSLGHIETLLIDHSISWLLCCHCETSTGIVIDLKKLTTLSARNNCLCFVDCMSTVGTMPLDLSGVAIATASSGKGLASIPGLALVMGNIEPVIKTACPIYLDLYHYRFSGGIPFTIPSNLLNALYISALQKLRVEQYQLITEYRREIFKMLDVLSIVPFSNEDSAVFTVVPSKSMIKHFISLCERGQLVVSYQSDYLRNRNWFQIATFGYYSASQLNLVSKTVKQFGALKFEAPVPSCVH